MGLWPCVPVWGCLVCARAKSLPKLSPSFSSLSITLSKLVHTGSEKSPLLTWNGGVLSPEPVFLNVHGAKESIPRNELRQPIWPGGPVR
jgi:hypothetical protein